MNQYIKKENNNTSVYADCYFGIVPEEAYWHIIIDKYTEVAESERTFYFLFHYSTDSSSIDWFGFLECIDVVSTILVCTILVCIILLRIFKKFQNRI